MLLGRIEDSSIITEAVLKAARNIINGKEFTKILLKRGRGKGIIGERRV